MKTRFKILWSMGAALSLHSPLVCADSTAASTHQHDTAKPAALQDAPANLLALARFFNLDATDEALRRSWQARSSTAASGAQLMAVAQRQKWPLSLRRASWHQLQKRGEVALIHLQAPQQWVVLQAIGEKQSLMYANGHDELLDNATLQKRYSGQAIVLAGEKLAALSIDSPVRLLKVLSVGGASELVERVALRNGGDKPLRVSVASTSCGCTGAVIEPAIIAPGQSAVLTARMHASDNRTVTVNLKSDDVRRPFAVIALQSQAPTGIVAPPTLFVSAHKGRAATASTSLSLPPGAIIEKVSTRQKFLQAQFDSANVAQPKLTISLDDKAPTGRFSDEATLQLKGAAVRQIIVPIEGFVSDDISVEPAMVTLGDVATGSTTRKTVIVQGPTDRPFSIRSIHVSNPRLSAKASADVVASSHAVEIEIHADGDAKMPIQERATLLLSDGRTLDVDVWGSTVTATAAQTPLKVGQAAPDFSAPDAGGQMRRLADLRGRKNLLLTFFPRCFTGGCAGQLASLQRELPNFARSDTEVWAVSVDAADGENGQRAFAAKLMLQFPLLPDTNRAICKLYGAAQTDDDLAARQSVLIDKAGIVRWIDRGVQVNTHGADVLRQMQHLGW